MSIVQSLDIRSERGLAPSRHRRFLIMEGGPAHGIELRIGLMPSSTQSIVRRWIAIIAVTWVPLLLLSALQGHAFGAHLGVVPFINDFAVHARFLLAAPLLLLAGLVLSPRIADAAGHFVESGLVIDDDLPRYDRAIEKGLKLRNSAVVELVLLVMAYGMTVTNLSSLAVKTSTWYSTRTSSGFSITWAGWWFILFCVPLMQFLILRWAWRLALWAQFLWRMSHLRLRIVPTHPDGAGGLGFVGQAQQSFGVVLFACSVGVAGVLATSIVYDKQPLVNFAPMIATYVFTAVAVTMLPTFTFCRMLYLAKLRGLLQYGTLATEYAAAFDDKWVHTPRSTTEPLLGAADIQSLADLGNSYSFIERMNSAPIGLSLPIYLALACLIPMAPLLLTMMPIGDIFRMLVKAFI